MASCQLNNSRSRAQSRGQCTLNGPTGSNPLSKGFGWDANLVSPVRNTLGYATERQQMIATGIARLLYPRSPSAVLSRISLRVINTFDGVFTRWSRTHVLKEHRKRLPFVTDPDPATSVVAVVLVGWVLAARSHLLPHDIFRTRPFAVCSVTATNTPFASPTTKFSSADDRQRTAITHAVPVSATLAGLREGCDGPVTKSQSSQVCRFGEVCVRLELSHDVSFLWKRLLWLEPAGRVTAPLARFIIPGPLAA